MRRDQKAFSEATGKVSDWSVGRKLGGVFAALALIHLCVGAVGPPPVSIAPGQPYFQPSHRLPGIGLDRQDMSDLVLQARTEQLIESETFPILCDPRAIRWAQNITDPQLQTIFHQAAEGNDFPEKTLEALAFVESGGDPNAQSPTGPKGIMQIAGQTASRMGLKKYRETRYKWVPQQKLIKKGKDGQPSVYKDLPPKRVSYKVEIDERLDPGKAIPAAARFLAKLADRYGRVDFALWAYHSGEGNPDRALALARKYGIGEPTVPKLFFGNSPAWRKELFSLIEKDMDKDFGPTYYFTVARAEQLIALYRKDPDAYKALARKYADPINPDRRTPNRLWIWYSPKDMYQANADLEAARDKQLVSVPQDPSFFSYALRTVGAEAIGEKDPEHRELFLQDPPAVVGALEYVAFETRRLWEASHPKKDKFMPIEITSLVRNLAYQQLLKDNPNSYTDFPTHAIGAVDMSYLRLPEWETTCLKFVVWDIGLDEYISYFLESKARKTIHFGSSPAHNDFFITVYQEAQKSYLGTRTPR